MLARTEIGGYCSHCQALRAQEIAEAAMPAAALNVRRRESPSRRPALPPAASAGAESLRPAHRACPLSRCRSSIGRHADNNLVLRDNRASRSHARIIAENGAYVIEDLNSRHGTWVNGERVARHVLRNSDRIEFGVRESYPAHLHARAPARSIAFSDQISAPARTPERSDANNLAKLRSLVEVARALQNSLSTQEVLTAVVDAALAVTGCERGFLMLRKDAELEVAVARDRDGQGARSRRICACRPP